MSTHSVEAIKHGSARLRHEAWPDAHCRDHAVRRHGARAQRIDGRGIVVVVQAGQVQALQGQASDFGQGQGVWHKRYWSKVALALVE